MAGPRFPGDPGGNAANRPQFERRSFFPLIAAEGSPTLARLSRSDIGLETGPKIGYP